MCKHADKHTHKYAHVNACRHVQPDVEAVITARDLIVIWLTIKKQVTVITVGYNRCITDAGPRAVITASFT